MWRAAGVSYLQYSTEMATILRQCLKEPVRSKVLAKNELWILEKKWVNGVEAARARESLGLRLFSNTVSYKFKYIRVFHYNFKYNVKLKLFSTPPQATPRRTRRSTRSARWARRSARS